MEKEKPTDSGEIESDPMVGVTEIKGEGVAKEPEVDIDVQKHQDAADPDAAKNEVPDVVPTGIKPQDDKEQKTSVKEVTTQQPANGPKQSHKWRNCILLGLLGLCFLCVVCVAGTYIFRDSLIQAVKTSISKPDTSLKTITKEDIQSSKTDLPTLIDQKTTNATVNPDGSKTLTFTENELLTAAFKDVKDVDPSAIALKFQSGSAKLQIDVGKILASQKDNLKNSEQLKNLPVDLSVLNGVIINATVVTISNGTKLSVQNLSTGNAVLDSLIPADALNSLNDQLDLNKFLSSEDGSQSFKIEKVEFLDGQMKITIKE